MRTLFIGEDTSYRNNNYVWAYSIDAGELSRILSVPMGAVATGLQAVDNYNGRSYIMSNFQAPGHFGDSDPAWAQVEPLIKQVEQQPQGRHRLHRHHERSRAAGNDPLTASRPASPETSRPTGRANSPIARRPHVRRRRRFGDLDAQGHDVTEVHALRAPHRDLHRHQVALLPRHQRRGEGRHPERHGGRDAAPAVAEFGLLAQLGRRVGAARRTGAARGRALRRSRR